MSTSSTNATGASRVTAKRRLIGTGIAATLLLSCSPVALHAESNADLAREIAELKAQIHEMRGALQETRGETRRTAAKVKAVASRGPDAYMPPYANPIPVGATPAFVTADKKLQFGAVTITPGGFIEAAGIYRSRNTNSDISSNFTVPFPNNVPSHTNEQHFSARDTRIALLAEAPITPTMIAAGYIEMDFNAAAPTANQNETNSYNPRLRHLYATLDNSEYGLHVLAGQDWSLVTLNTKGITPRNELTPNIIDSSQHVGSLYARQPGIRLTKDWNKKLWVAIAAEESQTTGCPAVGNNLTPGGAFNVQCSQVGTGGSFGTNTQAYSFNHIPDIIGKVAYEAKIGDHDVHLEALGVYTDLYNTVSPAGAPGILNTRDTTGWGAGAGIVASVIPKRLDFQLNGIYGRGIGRYGPVGDADSIVNANGSLTPVQEYIAMAGLTAHVTPSLDLISYAGIEGQQRTLSGTTFANQAGIGGPGTVNTGCFTAGAAAAACNGNTRYTFEITGGFWDKLYSGNFGEVRVGATYSYLKRDVFGTGIYAGGTAAQRTNAGDRTIDDHIVFTSLRYYPFAAPAAPPPAVVAKY